MSMLNDADRLIHTATGEYPITVAQFRTLGHGWVFGPEVDEDVVNGCGYFHVNPVEPPKGDVVTIGAPEQREDGKWYDTYTARDYTPEEAAYHLEAVKNNAYQRINDVTAEVCAKGAPFEFTSGVQHVQLRSTDLTNLTGLAQMAARSPDRDFYFRTYENEVNKVSAQDIVDLTNAAFEAFEAVMARKWQTEAEVAAAKTDAAVPRLGAIREKIYI